VTRDNNNNNNNNNNNIIIIIIIHLLSLPVGLYGRKTCSVTLREEHRLRVFRNKVLRKIFGLNGTR